MAHAILITFGALMAISPGTQLGSYEIVESIGAGGMGEVYKATDTRLGRLVAIKVLTTQFADREEFKQRFDREAQTIAGLTHPHICTLYDVGLENDTHFLVMEFLEGETLATRLARGQMSLEEALLVAIQVSQALDKAHTLGVTHRDLKPGNIMLTKAGAKLMDFGLAKRRAGVEGSSASIMPTMATGDLTQQGAIIGTVQYMAPEQIEGQEADPRTDIFALGMIIYEMVTGKKAFTGKSHASLMASILTTNPEPMTTSQVMTPPALQRVIEICMAKDPRDRWQTAHDVMLQLRWIAEGGSGVGLPQPVAHRRKHREWLAWSVAAVAFAAAVTWGTLYFRKPAEEVRVMRFGILPNEGTQFGPPNAAIRPFPAISPDGKRIAYQGQEPNGPVMLYVRSLDSLQAQRLAGTEGAAMPFWSPDSKYIAFSADNRLKKIDAGGGPVQALADINQGANAEGSWGKDGTILYSNGPGTAPMNTAGILSIPDTGGVPPKVLIAPTDRREIGLRAPYFLPDGKHFLYLAQEPNVIWVGSLDPKEAPKQLRTSDSRAAYAHEGFLLYVFQGNLMAQKFDDKKLELSGEPFPVAEGVRVNANNGRTAFSISDNGTLVYRTGGASGLAGLVATWFERDGKPSAIANQTNDNRIPRLSPDGTQLLLERQPAGVSCVNCTDLWTIDLARGTNTRLTFGKGDSHVGTWSRDGTRVFYTNTASGKVEIYSRFATGVGNEDIILKSDLEIESVTSASRDHLLFTVQNKSTGNDIWYLPLSGDRKPMPFINTPFNQGNAQFSADGKWVAYQSNESGTVQVYVQPFPANGQRYLISVDGGNNPRWQRDQKELFFTSLRRTLMSVDIQINGSTLAAGKPTNLFLIPDATNNNFTVTADGKRFIFAAPPTIGSSGLSSTDNQPLTVVTNWTATIQH